MIERERWPQPLRAPDAPGSNPLESSDDGEKISYSIARKASEQYGEPGALIHQFSSPRAFDREVAALPNVPDAIKKILSDPRTHPAAHAEGYMLRSLKRQGPEFDFALAAAEYLSPLLKRDKNSDAQAIALQVVGMRGPDSTMWWTFAPYLYRSMLAKGITKEAAFERIVEWAKTSPEATETQSGKGIGLAGLEIFEEEGIHDYGLPRDVTNILHKFTAQEAERIVRDIFGIKEN